MAQVKLILSTHRMHLSTRQLVTVVAFIPPFGLAGVPVVVGVVGVAGVEPVSAGDDEAGSSCEKIGETKAQVVNIIFQIHQTALCFFLVNKIVFL